MKIIHYCDAEAKVFEADHVKGTVGRVLIGKNDGAQNFCMRLFELSPGGYTPKHAHEWEHEIFIHRGKGAAFKGGEWVPVESGTAVFIPGNVEHQMKNTCDEPMVMVCLIPSGHPEI
jgi:quercetin dioxygenase-like cupin family protein